MKNETLALTQELMSCIMQTDHWENVATTDPGIRDAEKKLNAVLDLLKHPKYRGIRAEISSAVWVLVSAYADAATLYGYHIAQVLQAVGGSPQEYSQFLLDRMKEVEATKDAGGGEAQ